MARIVASMFFLCKFFFSDLLLITLLSICPLTDWLDVIGSKYALLLSALQAPEESACS